MKQLPNHNSYTPKLYARPTIVLQSKFLRRLMVITKLELSRGLRSSKTVLVGKKELARAQVFLSSFSPELRTQRWEMHQRVDALIGERKCSSLDHS